MFKLIKDYENFYMINENGEVKSLSRTFINNKGYICKTKEKILKPQKRNNYLFVRLCKHNIKQAFSVHRLVAETFLEKPLNKDFVNHKDGNRFNNHVKNLEWVTSSDNMIHSYYVLKKNKKRVFCISTNTFYNSIREASRLANVSVASIIRSCKSNKKSAGFCWKYCD